MYVLPLLAGLNPVALFEGTSAVSTIGTEVTSLLALVLQWCTSITTWILGDGLAVMFFAIMFIMLAIHVINSLVHKFS